MLKSKNLRWWSKTLLCHSFFYSQRCEKIRLLKLREMLEYARNEKPLGAGCLFFDSAQRGCCNSVGEKDLYSGRGEGRLKASHYE